jgi:hypothetical protein
MNGRANVSDTATSFLELSRVLTGESELDPKLGGEYQDRLQAAYPAEFESLLAAFSSLDSGGDMAAQLKERLDGDSASARLAREVMAIWFTSQFTQPDGRPSAGTAEQWKSGLLWKVIDAPVPAAVPGEYGYWAEKPGRPKRRREN